MKKIALSTAGLLLICTNQWASANNDQIDISPLLGDYVVGNPGYETVAPVFQLADNNADGKKDGVNFHFDVFKAGSQIRLFSTPERYLGFGCSLSNPDLSGADIGFKRLGSNVVIHLELKEYLCGKSYLYGINLSAIGKVPWVKSIQGSLYGVTVLPDMNKNGTGELAVSALTDITPSNYYDNSQNSALYLFDGLTGNTVATAQSYAIFR